MNKRLLHTYICRYTYVYIYVCMRDHSRIRESSLLVFTLGMLLPELFPFGASEARLSFLSVDRRTCLSAWTSTGNPGGRRIGKPFRFMIPELYMLCLSVRTYTEHI